MPTPSPPLRGIREEVPYSLSYCNDSLFSCSAPIAANSSRHDDVIIKQLLQEITLPNTNNVLDISEQLVKLYFIYSDTSANEDNSFRNHIR